MVGFRHEHYKEMHQGFVQEMVERLLNNDVPDEVRDILTSAKLYIMINLPR